MDFITYLLDCKNDFLKKYGEPPTHLVMGNTMIKLLIRTLVENSIYYEKTTDSIRLSGMNVRLYGKRDITIESKNCSHTYSEYMEVKNDKVSGIDSANILWH